MDKHPIQKEIEVYELQFCYRSMDLLLIEINYQAYSCMGQEGLKCEVIDFGIIHLIHHQYNGRGGGMGFLNFPLIVPFNPISSPFLSSSCFFVPFNIFI